MSFTNNFNYALEQREYSAYRFAKIIGVNGQSVANWKAGTVIPHPKTRQKIAEHFGITLAELDGDELPVLPPEGAKKAPATEGEGLSATVQELFDFIDTATGAELNELLRYAQFLMSKR